MEGSKNAMYTQAGRSRGWTQAMNTDMPMPASPTAPAPMQPMAQAIPEPPVVKLPAQEPEMNISAGICTLPVMAYVPVQKWQELYETEQGFGRGTIFTELDLPFVGEGACRHE